MRFIGRENELKLIQRNIQKDCNSNILIYGRRRIGKSELIKQVIQQFNGKKIYYECKETSENNNVDSLANLISEEFSFPPLKFNSMEELLDFMFKQSMNEKIILVLDEYPFIRQKVEGMDSILQSLIDHYSNESNLKLILCGSYVDVMKSMIAHHSPLFGRISLVIDLKPMDYYDSAKFYPNYSNEDKVRLYSVFGGIPYYNSLIDQSMSVKENIIELIASPNARLEFEISAYLKSEISKMNNANEVFDALSKGYYRYQDILSHSYVTSSPALADTLDQLIKMEIVYKEFPINQPNNKRKSGYRIGDQLSNFYYRYIYRYSSQLTLLDSDVFYTRYIEKDFETQYVPHEFERICKEYLVRMNRMGNIENIFDEIGKYYYDDPVNKINGEFDIVTKDMHGYIFYEAKFKNTPINQSIINEEIEQVQRTSLAPYRYGFFSKSGYDLLDSKDYYLYTLDDLYKL